jgi:hypothetical protein
MLQTFIIDTVTGRFPLAQQGDAGRRVGVSAGRRVGVRGMEEPFSLLDARYRQFERGIPSPEKNAQTPTRFAQWRSI